MLEKHYTLKEVCEALGVHRNTFLRWISAGKVKAIQLGRDWRIPESEIDRICSSGVQENPVLCKDDSEDDGDSNGHK
jgi:excisionase family DNA binding protein